MARIALKEAKVEALELLEKNWPDIVNEFKLHLKDKHHFRGAVHVDQEGARRRVKEAVFVALEDEERDELTGELMYQGYTDGEVIWVHKDIDYESMVGTLVHEALHDSVFILRTTRTLTKRGLSCADEHAVMTRLNGYPGLEAV